MAETTKSGEVFLILLSPKYAERTVVDTDSVSVGYAK